METTLVIHPVICASQMLSFGEFVGTKEALDVGRENVLHERTQTSVFPPTGGFTEKSHKTLIQLSSAYVAEPLDYVGGLGGALLWVRHTVTMRYERSNPSFSRTLAFYQTHSSSCL